MNHRIWLLIFGSFFFSAHFLRCELLYFRPIVNSLEDPIQVTFKVKSFRFTNRRFRWSSTEEMITVPPGEILDCCARIRSSDRERRLEVSFHPALRSVDEEEPIYGPFDLEMGGGEGVDSAMLEEILAGADQRVAQEEFFEAADRFTVRSYVLAKIVSRIQIRVKRLSVDETIQDEVMLSMRVLRNETTRGIVDQYGYCTHCSWIMQGRSFFQGSPLQVIDGYCCGISFASQETRGGDAYGCLISSLGICVFISFISSVVLFATIV